MRAPPLRYNRRSLSSGSEPLLVLSSLTTPLAWCMAHAAHGKSQSRHGMVGAALPNGLLLLALLLLACWVRPARRITRASTCTLLACRAVLHSLVVAVRHSATCCPPLVGSGQRALREPAAARRW